MMTNLYGRGSKRKLANEMYKKALKYFESIMGNDITSTTDLNKVGNIVFRENWKGTFPSDRLPKLQKGEVCIINVDKHNQLGSHWISVCRSKKSGKLWIYDSYGRKINKLIPHLKNLKFLEPEDDPEQDLNGKREDNCGQRSLSYILVFTQFGEDVAIYI